ncbi:TRAP transporter fused permease subunit [Candidatus Poribacteria bacterium]|nr:TRAP transporter fused permease subunit [Candidatus Poribacteria bacterium]
MDHNIPPSFTVMLQRIRRILFCTCAVFLAVFVLAEVNYPRLSPQAQLAIFAMLGLVLVFLKYPIHRRFADYIAFQILDFVFALAVVICFGYILIQTEPMFKRFWIDGQQLGDRAGMGTTTDYVIGLLGLLLVLEGTRRAIGLTLCLLSLAFLGYAAFGQSMPDWLFPHRGYSWERIVSQTFLHSQGVFGIALKVMFTYVFLFVLFGALLEKTGATGYIINFARRLFRSSVGGPAKVAVVSSGAMGSLSGSAVANTATTGTFTIPMMRSSGFRPTVAGGIEAAASSGGALVPPIMGAGAYMMLEIVEPAVTYLQIIKAALIPAILYYTALLLIVHFYAKRVGASTEVPQENVTETSPSKTGIEGLVFLVAFITLILFLLLGYTPFRAVSLSLLFILILIGIRGVWEIIKQVIHSDTSSSGASIRQTPLIFTRQIWIGICRMVEAMDQAAHAGVSLIAAASCVGLILGVVTLTGIGAKLPGTLLPLAENSRLLALALLMISTIILGMGLPSSVCYLLMATLVGPVLSELGLVPLAAHLFIFYFGMMAMVTPPVALAAYTAAAIAGTGIMQTGIAAFRFALVGFALPYAFTLKPELLLLSPDGGTASFFTIATSVLIAIFGIISLAASVSGHWFAPLNFWTRAGLLAVAAVFFLTHLGWVQLAAFIAIAIIGFFNWRSRKSLLDH